jgi:mitochondrial fission protein ELM1
VCVCLVGGGGEITVNKKGTKCVHTSVSKKVPNLFTYQYQKGSKCVHTSVSKKVPHISIQNGRRHIMLVMKTKGHYFI